MVLTPKTFNFFFSVCDSNGMTTANSLLEANKTTLGNAMTWTERDHTE